MSVLQPDELRDLVETPLSDDRLTAVIEREEAWLARIVGKLVGERTQSFRPTADEASASLWLRRPTDAVEVTDAGSVLDEDLVDLLNDGREVRRINAFWAGALAWPLQTVDVAYTPNDEGEVKAVLIELTRLRLTENGLISETTGQYSATRDPKWLAGERDRLARSLLHQPSITSVRLVSGRDRSAPWAV